MKTGSRLPRQAVLDLAWLNRYTPDIYDGDLKLAYREQLDDSRPGNGVPVTGRETRDWKSPG